MDSCVIGDVFRETSNHERKGRFTVENLNYVHCVLISDNCQLISKATASTSRDACDYPCAKLTLLPKNSTRTNQKDNYTVVLKEACFNTEARLTDPEDNDLLPNVIICFVSLEYRDESLLRITEITKKMEAHSWRCPLILVAFRQNPSEVPDEDVMTAIKSLARMSSVYSCIETSGISKKIIRHAVILSLLAARPTVAAMRQVSDFVVFDEEALKRKEEQSQPFRPRKPSLGERIEKLGELKKNRRNKSCKIQ
ncbi:unnamed protein product [Auanema sp. JU1783]|nr:unnamed protein product [Auanema sp. JU1783]